MRGILLGTLGGLVVGIAGTFAYNTYLGDGPKLATAQADLASASADLTKANQGTLKFKSETDALSAEVKQLRTHSEELKQQVEELKKASPESTTNAAPNPMENIMKTVMANKNKEKLLLLKSRLNLTPEQEAAVQAAMDEETKRAERMFAGGKMDPTAFKNDPNKPKSLDQTLNDILNPDQKTIYKQMQDDEKKSMVETVATYQMNQLAPALQLTETQKDQVFSALSQIQSNAMDPATYKNNSPGTNPMTILENQAKAKDEALAKILTPAQMEIYRQRAQSELEMQKTMMQRFTPPAAAAPAPAQ